MKPIRISEHITYEEATFSWTAKRLGIDNTPPPKALKNMRAVAENVFEPARRHFGVPIKVNSFYRSPLLNRIIGGATKSQHIKGEAIDIDDVYSLRYGITNRDFFCYIADRLQFDQLIWEFGDRTNPDWVHVSFKRKGGNRGQILIAARRNGRTIYKRITRKQAKALCNGEYWPW